MEQPDQEPLLFVVGLLDCCTGSAGYRQDFTLKAAAHIL